MSIEDRRQKFDEKVDSLTASAGGDEMHLLQLFATSATEYLHLDSCDEASFLLEDALEIADRHSKVDPSILMPLLGNLGRAYQRLGRYNDAVKVLNRLVSLCTTCLGSSHLDTGFALLDLAFVHGHLLHKDHALTLFHQASTVLCGLLLPSHPKLAHFYYSHGEILLCCCRYDKSISIYTKALEVLNSVGTNDRASESLRADIVGGLLVVYLRRVERNKAIEMGLSLLNLYDKLYGSKSKRSTDILAVLGRLYVEVGDLQQAFSACSRSLAIAIETERSDSKHASDSMNVLADVYQLSGRYDEAVVMYLGALSSSSNRAPDIQMAAVIIKLSSLFLSLHMYDEAEHYCEKALNTFKPSGDHPVRITNFIRLLVEINERKGLHREAAALKIQLDIPYSPMDPQVGAIVCASCFQAVDEFGKGLMKCSVCRIVRYCSKECQKSDWQRHKNFCKKTLTNTPSH